METGRKQTEQSRLDHSGAGGTAGVFFFDPADRIYTEHFAGNPVVPGSLIIHAFMSAGKNFFKTGASLIVENFRFKEFIAPGEYPFQIRLMSDRIECTLYNDGRTVVTGTLKI